jgi:hypothetical protein
MQMHLRQEDGGVVKGSGSKQQKTKILKNGLAQQQQKKMSTNRRGVYRTLMMRVSAASCCRSDSRIVASVADPAACSMCGTISLRNGTHFKPKF